MQIKLHITALQIPLFWEAPDLNRKSIDEKLTKLHDTDIVLLPEMFTSGFTMNPNTVAESMDGTTIKWMKSWAYKLEAAVGGSIVIEEDGAYLNRFVWVTPSGKLSFYDKHHTFTMAGEDQVYQRGNDDGIIIFKGWKICLRICYDLRFPVWSRNTQDYDLLIYVANWPKPRISAWDTLLKARAIENMSYVVGVNRCGEDSKRNDYPGHSAIYDSLGNCISGDLSSETKNISAFINYQELQAHRKKLRFLEDRDNFDLC